MTGLDLTTLALAGVIGALFGALIAWLVSAGLSRREVARVERAWQGRYEQARSDTVRARSDARQFEKLAAEAAGKVVTTEQDVASLRRQAEDLGRLLTELRRSREAIRHQNVQLTGELESLKVRVAEAPAPAERDREQRTLSERLAAAQKRLDEAVAARHASEADRTRLALQVEMVTRQLQQSNELARADRARHDSARALQATVVTDLRRQLEDATRNSAAGSRAGMIELQERLAAAMAELGAARAEAERVEPLRRQVEDREALIRSLVAERDEAAAALVRQERELLQRIEALVQQVAAGARAEQALKERDRDRAKQSRHLAAVERERDELAIALKRSEVEAASLRTEIKDRDARFRVLLADRRAVVEAKDGEMARLSSLVSRTRGPSNGNGSGDDLKRITGIGPSLEKMLKSRGIHSFRQIALWTEADIERIAAELGAFRSRIKKDRWIEQARRKHEELYGEPLEQ